MEESAYEDTEHRRPLPALRLLAAMADIAGFPAPKKEGPNDGNAVAYLRPPVTPERKEERST